MSVQKKNTKDSSNFNNTKKKPERQLYRRGILLPGSVGEGFSEQETNVEEAKAMMKLLLKRTTRPVVSTGQFAY